HWARLPQRSLHVLGALTASVGPAGHLRAAPWLLQYHRREPRNPFLPPFAFEIWRRGLAELSIRSDVALPDARGVDYFQIDANHWALPLRSPSLRHLSFPDPEGFGGGRPLVWETDNFELAPGLRVRRGRLKASSPRGERVP